LIFVTVGTQLAFDRMVAAVDRWAATRNAEVFAQIGPGNLVPRHLEYRRFMTPAQCRERMLAAEAIVAHAGMGTILSALEMGKPLLVMPRRAALGEHRNDHQLATTRRFAELGSVSVAMDAAELHRKLDELDRVEAHDRIGPHAGDPFIAALREFIAGHPLRA
jgi:UDP-N-acetylglucosamine transferase subunit ALG13